MSPGSIDKLLSVTSVTGLLLFLGVFVGVAAWVATRSRRDINEWSQMPLEDQR